MTTEQIVVALVALLIGALLKSISGLGVPLVTVPAISWVADIETAVVLTSVPNLALNGALAWRERGRYGETRDLPVLGATAVVGAVVGTVTLVSVPERILIGLLVAVVVAYAVIFFTNPAFEIAPHRGRRYAPAIGLASGAMQGAVGISAPILASWIHAYRLPRNAHILSITLLFALAGAAQIPTLAVNNTDGTLWALSAAGCGPALATIPAGERLRNAVSSLTFDRIVVATLTASTVGLAIRTFT